jgi:hypothetical protein
MLYIEPISISLSWLPGEQPDGKYEAAAQLQYACVLSFTIRCAV